MTTFYSTNQLPEVLPIGTIYTCSSGKYELLEPATRRPKGKPLNSETYPCVRRRRLGDGVVFQSSHAGWLVSDAVFTLPAAPPECAEVPKLGIADAAWVRERLDEFRHDFKASLYARPFTVKPFALPSPPAPVSEARPIQAGDWVECVDASLSRFLVSGHEYHVAEVRGAGWFVLTGVDCTMYTPARFKRVDGPHPAKDSAEPQRVTSTAATATSVAPAVPNTGLLRDKPTCSECNAPAVLNGGLCVYCDYSTNEGKETRPARDWLAGLRTSKDPRMVEPRKRLAAMARNEQPRLLHAADRRELGRAHPWECFDDLESR